MSIFSAGNAPIVNQRIQQAAGAARDAQRVRGGKAGPGASRGADEVDLEIQNSATDEPVRSLKGNADQETADDREQQDHYRAPTKDEKGARSKRPPLDIQG